MKVLMAEAARLGARVQLGHLDGRTLCGIYNEAERLITVEIGLAMPQLKETLAHELGHCFHADVESSPLHERRADRYAARLLIDPMAYKAAELIDPDPAAIAAELGQTRRMVRLFQKEWLPTLSLSRRLRAV